MRNIKGVCLEFAARVWIWDVTQKYVQILLGSQLLAVLRNFKMWDLVRSWETTGGAMLWGSCLFLFFLYLPSHDEIEVAYYMILHSVLLQVSNIRTKQTGTAISKTEPK